jgi:hypothetical protein
VIRLSEGIFMGGLTKPDQESPNPRRLSCAPSVRIGGNLYREFGLDANQINNGPLSLNQVQIFQSDADLGTSYTMLQEADLTHDAVIGFAGLTPLFQMNNAQDANGALTDNIEIQLDSSNGSGLGDMFLYVPYHRFDDSQPNSYITLFSQFGTPGKCNCNAGFEEWFVRTGVLPVPEPSSLALFGTCTLALLTYGCRLWKK